MRSVRRIIGCGSLATLALMLVLPSVASADTAPNLSCGSTQPGPCTQTAHYSNDDEFGTPLPPTPGCPDVISNDYVHIVGTGNGIEHVTVNKAQDAWFTQTFTGDATFTPYPPSSVITDDQGNVTGISGPPDPNVPAFTGHLTEWFGGEFNNKNANDHGTININATVNGQALSLHVNFHLQWARCRSQRTTDTRVRARQLLANTTNETIIRRRPGRLSAPGRRRSRARNNTPERASRVRTEG
jgi:hypothetical protein